MNAAARIVEEVAAVGGVLTVTGDGARIRAELPEDALGLVDLLRAHKADVIALLRERSCAALPPNHPPDSAAPADPAAWRQPFAQWLALAVVRHWRAAGGVGALHRAYCDWEIARDGVPCKRETFEILLRERGFMLRTFSGVSLVEGLALWPDVERLRETGRLQ